jgi:hypothetical protein
MSERMSGTEQHDSSMKVPSAKYLGKRGRNGRKPHTVRCWTTDGSQHESSYATDREAIDARDKMLADAKQPVSNLTFNQVFERAGSQSIRSRTRPSGTTAGCTPAVCQSP